MKLNLSLSAKLNAFITVAVLIPLLLLGGAMLRTIRNIALDNLESFVLENGSRRQVAIENDLTTALNLVNEFIVENERTLLFALNQENSGLIDEIREDVDSHFRSQLLEEGYFNSIHLVSEHSLPVISAVRDDQTDVDNIQQVRVTVSSIAGRLQINQGDRQASGITSRNGVTRIEVLTALVSDDDEGNQRVEGYLLVDLDLDEIFINNLVSSDIDLEAGFDTYAYVMLSTDDNLIVIAPEGIETLIDTSSAGAQRAQANRASGVGIYAVGEAETRREVVGYSATLIIDREEFALVAEANTETIFQDVTEQILGTMFVLVIAISVVILLSVLLLTNRMVLPPIRNLRTAILAVIRGDFEVPISAVGRNDELGSLASSFVDMRQHMRNVTADMEAKLQARTRDVKITQDIAREVTAERDLPTLMTTVVNLIIRNFSGIYHAQIFLIDEDGKFAVLRASTGAAGRELLSRGHKLGVGSVSVIGQVTEQGQVVVARDTAESSLHRQNEFLGETRAELAIPLRLGEKIIGALDVQSKQPDSFADDQVAALQTLADQITIAIENTRLYADTERLLREAEIEQGLETRRAWQQQLNQQRQSGLQTRIGAETGYNFKRLSDAVMRSGKAIVGDATDRNTIPFVVPISLRGQTLGVVEYEVPAVDFEYAKVLLAQELVLRLAISLENARLFQASQQATERERVVNDISAKLTGQTNIEDILQTAVREIEQALRTPQVAIRLAGSGNGKGANGSTKTSPNGNQSENSSR